MSLSTETRRIQYTLTGSGQVLPTTFKFFDATDLLVTKTVAGVDTVLALTTDYTVSGGGHPCAVGNVTMVAGENGDIITIQGNIPAWQLVDFTTGGPFPALTLTEQVDRLTMLVQQLLLALARTLRLPTTEDGVDPIPLEGRPDTVMGFDHNGNFYLYPLADLLQYIEGVPVTSAVIIALTSHAALRSISTNGLYSVNTVRIVSLDGVSEQWQLRAGTQADDDTGYIRPADYADGTYEFVWEKIA